MTAFAATFTMRVKNLCRRFGSDRAGNIAMTFAIVSVPLLGAMGAGVDYIRALNLHRELQGNLDAALVAAVKDIGTKDETALKLQLANWLAADATVSGSYTLDTDKVVIDKSTSGITARVTANVDTTFMRVMGKTSIPIAVQASVAGGQTITKSAFSMYFVLDRSGSMAYDTTTSYTTTCTTGKKKKKKTVTCTKLYTKMEALKLAAADLLDQFDTADPSHKFVRTGAVSYDTVKDTETPLAWGVTAVEDYVEALTPRDTTNSGEAFQLAYESLMVTGASSEAKLHLDKSGVTDPKKYIVFMTDGENNVYGADTKTKKYCDLARTNKIQVYSIAFMAPKNGQDLLKYCATGSSDYFAAESTADLVAAFKTIGESASQNLIRLTN
jgi:Flp pilus assembly protein TadG